MVNKNHIKDINHVEAILNDLRDYVIAYEEQIGDLSENECEKITFQLAEIDGFIIGKQAYTSSNVAMADIRMMCYWEYLDRKYDFSVLVTKLREYEGDA